MAKQNERNEKENIEMKELSEGPNFSETKQMVEDDFGNTKDESNQGDVPKVDLDIVVDLDVDDSSVKINEVLDGFYAEDEALDNNRDKSKTTVEFDEDVIEDTQNVEESKEVNKPVSFGVLNILDLDSMLESNLFEDTDIINIATDFASNSDENYELIIKINPNHKSYNIIKALQNSKKNNVFILSSVDEVFEKAEKFTPLTQNGGVNVFSENWDLNKKVLNYFKYNRCNTCGFAALSGSKGPLTASLSRKQNMFMVSRENLIRSSKASGKKRDLFFDAARFMKINEIFGIVEELDNHQIYARETGKRAKTSIETGSHGPTEQTIIDRPDNLYTFGSAASATAKFGASLFLYAENSSWMNYGPDAAARLGRLITQYLASRGKVNKLTIQESNRVINDLTEIYIDLINNTEMTPSDALFFAVVEATTKHELESIQAKDRMDKANFDLKKSTVFAALPLTFMLASLGAGIYYLIKLRDQSINVPDYVELSKQSIVATTSLSIISKFINFASNFYAFKTDATNRKQLNKLTDAKKERKQTKNEVLKQYLDLKTKGEFLRSVQNFKKSIASSTKKNDSKRADNKTKRDLVIFDYSLFFNIIGDEITLLNKNINSLLNIDPKFDVQILIPEDLDQKSSDAIVKKLSSAINRNPNLERLKIINMEQTVYNKDVSPEIELVLKTNLENYNTKIYVGEDVKKMNLMRALDFAYDNVIVTEVFDKQVKNRAYAHISVNSLLEIIPYLEKRTKAHEAAKYKPIEEFYERAIKIPSRLAPIYIPPINLDFMNKRAENLNIIDLDSILFVSEEPNELAEKILDRVINIIEAQEDKLALGTKNKDTSLLDPLNKFIIIGNQNIIDSLQKELNTKDKDNHANSKKSIILEVKEADRYNFYEKIDDYFPNKSFSQIRIVSDDSSELREAYNALDFDVDMYCSIGINSNRNCIAFADGIDNFFNAFSDKKTDLFSQSFVTSLNKIQEAKVIDPAKAKDNSLKIEFLKSVNQVSDIVARFGVIFINVGSFFIPSIFDPAVNAWNSLGAAIGTSISSSGRMKIDRIQAKELYSRFVNKTCAYLAAQGYDKGQIVDIAALAAEEFERVVNGFIKDEKAKSYEGVFDIMTKVSGVSGFMFFMAQILTQGLWTEKIKKQVFDKYNLTEGYESLNKTDLFYRPENDTDQSILYGSDIKSESEEFSYGSFLASNSFAVVAFAAVMVSQFSSIFYNRSNDKTKARYLQQIKDYSKKPFEDKIDEITQGYLESLEEEIELIPLVSSQENSVPIDYTTYDNLLRENSKIFENQVSKVGEGIDFEKIYNERTEENKAIFLAGVTNKEVMDLNFDYKQSLANNPIKRLERPEQVEIITQERYKDFDIKNYDDVGLKKYKESMELLETTIAEVASHRVLRDDSETFKIISETVARELDLYRAYAELGAELGIPVVHDHANVANLMSGSQNAIHFNLSLDQIMELQMMVKDPIFQIFYEQLDKIKIDGIKLNDTKRHELWKKLFENSKHDELTLKNIGLKPVEEKRIKKTFNDVFFEKDKQRENLKVIIDQIQLGGFDVALRLAMDRDVNRIKDKVVIDTPELAKLRSIIDDDSFQSLLKKIDNLMNSESLREKLWLSLFQGLELTTESSLSDKEKIFGKDVYGFQVLKNQRSNYPGIITKEINGEEVYFKEFDKNKEKIYMEIKSSFDEIFKDKEEQKKTLESYWRYGGVEFINGMYEQSIRSESKLKFEVLQPTFINKFLGDPKDAFESKINAELEAKAKDDLEKAKGDFEKAKRANEKAKGDLEKAKRAHEKAKDQGDSKTEEKVKINAELEAKAKGNLEKAKGDFEKAKRAYEKAKDQDDFKTEEKVKMNIHQIDKAYRLYAMLMIHKDFANYEVDEKNVINPKDHEILKDGNRIRNIEETVNRFVWPGKPNSPLSILDHIDPNKGEGISKNALFRARMEFLGYSDIIMRQIYKLPEQSFKRLQEIYKDKYGGELRKDTSSKLILNTLIDGGPLSLDSRNNLRVPKSKEEKDQILVGMDKDVLEYIDQPSKAEKLLVSGNPSYGHPQMSVKIKRGGDSNNIIDTVEQLKKIRPNAPKVIEQYVEQVEKLGLTTAAGVSSSTARNFAVAESLGVLKTEKDVFNFTEATIAHFVKSGHHSVVEVLYGAANVGTDTIKQLEISPLLHQKVNPLDSTFTEEVNKNLLEREVDFERQVMLKEFNSKISHHAEDSKTLLMERFIKLENSQQDELLTNDSSSIEDKLNEFEQIFHQPVKTLDSPSATEKKVDSLKTLDDYSRAINLETFKSMISHHAEGSKTLLEERFEKLKTSQQEEFFLNSHSNIEDKLNDLEQIGLIPSTSNESAHKTSTSSNDSKFSAELKEKKPAFKGRASLESLTQPSLERTIERPAKKGKAGGKPSLTPKSTKSVSKK